MSRFSDTSGALFGEEARIVHGLSLYPLTMRNYIEWLDAKPALTLRLSTLPAVFAVRCYMDAIYGMEMQAYLDKREPIGFLARFARLLCLSIGWKADYTDQVIRFLVGDDPEQLKGVAVYAPCEIEEYAACMSNDGTLILPQKAMVPLAAKQKEPICFVENDENPYPVDSETNAVCGFRGMPGGMYAVRYTSIGRNPTVVLKPNQINDIRQAIADLNGEELPDESENPELIEARRKKREISAEKLDYNFVQLLDAVAYNSGGIRRAELADWTIAEFEMRQRTIDINKRFLLCAVCEANGGSWKNGNPYPSWCFEKSEDMYGAFDPVGDLLGKAGYTEEWLEGQIQAQKEQQKRM